MLVPSKLDREMKAESPAIEMEAVKASSETEAVNKISRDLASLAGKAAFCHSQTFDSQSNLTKAFPEGTSRPCQYSWSEIEVGSLIGTGTFSHVREVKVVGSCSCDTQCGSDCALLGKYAVKLLRSSIKTKRVTFQIGAIGLANEAKLLPHLKHQSIIQLHGTSQGCLSEAFFHSSGFFLVLERLDYTLEDLIKKLRIEEYKSKKATSFIRRVRGGPSLNEYRHVRRSEQLKDVAIPLASAMQYLHKKRVIYRDLKPANVGFDANGTIKLFDFGLALEIVESGRRMTPTSGSLRYMSPENVRSGDYDFSADVYSFGVLLWEVLTLETPFMGMTSEVILDVVVKSGVRPKLDAQVGCKSLQSIIRQCWDSRPETRP